MRAHALNAGPTQLHQGLAVFAVIFYLVCFGLGYSAAPTIVASEIYPTHARSYGVSQVVFFMWVGNFVVSATFLTETQTFGIDNTFYIYTAVTVVAWLYIYYELPETSGKTMEQIWTCFCGTNEVRVARRIAGAGRGVLVLSGVLCGKATLELTTATSLLPPGRKVHW